MLRTASAKNENFADAVFYIENAKIKLIKTQKQSDKTGKL